MTAVVVDALDWAVDAVRGLMGLPPHPPQLLKLAVKELTVRRAADVAIETRRTRLAYLRVRQGEEILFEGPVPLDGRIRIVPLTPDLVELLVTLESRHPAARYGTLKFESVLEQAPNGPAIERFDAPARVTLGDNIGCGWAAPRAERVRLAVIQDREVADHIGPPVGQMVVPAPRPGRVLLRLTGETGWGQTTLTRTVMVSPPRLGIALLEPTVQVGHPGQTLRFEWKTSGAESGWLIGPAAGPARRLPDAEGGCLLVTLGHKPAEFLVVARGYGGSEKRVLLRAVPDLLGCVETGDE